MQIRVAAGRRLLVAEYLSDQVTAMGLDGTVVQRVGGRTGSAPGKRDAPDGTASLGEVIHVADFYNHRI